MVMPVIFQTIEDTLFGVFGSMSLVAVLILFVFLIGFMFVGVDFRYSIFFVSPLSLAFVSIGWFPGWVGIMFWIFIIMFGGYLLWQRIRGEY